MYRRSINKKVVRESGDLSNYNLWGWILILDTLLAPGLFDYLTRLSEFRSGDFRLVRNDLFADDVATNVYYVKSALRYQPEFIITFN